MKWKRAFGELSKAKLIQLLSHPETYELTEPGWNLADVLRKPVRNLNDNDIQVVITDWLGHNTIRYNVKLVEFKEVDDTLNIPPGSSNRLLEAVAARNGYEIIDRGETMIRITRNRPTLGAFCRARL